MSKIQSQRSSLGFALWDLGCLGFVLKSQAFPASLGFAESQDLGFGIRVNCNDRSQFLGICSCLARAVEAVKNLAFRSDFVRAKSQVNKSQQVGIWYLAFSIWYLVFGIWGLGSWVLAFGIWYLVFGVWFI